MARFLAAGCLALLKGVNLLEQDIVTAAQRRGLDVVAALDGIEDGIRSHCRDHHRNFRGWAWHDGQRLELVKLAVPRDFFPGQQRIEYFERLDEFRPRRLDRGAKPANFVRECATTDAKNQPLIG